MEASRSGGFAYLFERFPSFTQTFCFREVLEMRRQGIEAPIWSIRDPRGEPKQDFPSELQGLTNYLPESFSARLESDQVFRRRARSAIGELRELWGGEGEKRRIYEALWLLPELQKQGVQHVHTHFAGTAARTAFWLKKLGGIRYSFTAHANDIFCDEPCDRLEMLLRECEFCISVSDFSVKYLTDKFPNLAEKVSRVYNGIHLDCFSRSEPVTLQPLILSVGRYIEKKGFVDLIAACGKLGDRPFECQIVGQGPLEEELRKLSAYDDRIQITGPKSETEIVELMSRTSVFVLPCVDEVGGGMDNLPTVIMEAMAASVPVISTPIAGVPEMVLDGKTGFLVSPHNVEALAAKIAEMLDNPIRAKEMGESGRQRCEDLFATERTTTQLREILIRHHAFETVGTGNWFSKMLGG